MKKIVLNGNRNVGVIALLYLKAKGYSLQVTGNSDPDVKSVAANIGVELIGWNDFLNGKCEYDLFLCVHGTEIIPKSNLKSWKMINIHPCLSLGLKGKNPIQRYINSEMTKASVESHFMTSDIDGGEIISQCFFNTNRCHIHEQFYNIAYVHYIDCIEMTLIKFWS